MPEQHAMARCVEAIAEHDLARAAVTCGACLYVLRKDLLLLSIDMDRDPLSTLLSKTEWRKMVKASHREGYSALRRSLKRKWH